MPIDLLATSMQCGSFRGARGAVLAATAFLRCLTLPATSQPWFRKPLLANRGSELIEPVVESVKLEDISIEEFGYDEVEIEPSLM